jgi:sec-independent protein translocase protein TatA
MLGLPDLLIVGGVALLVFGPKRLPELAKALGSGVRDFKKALEGEDDDKNKTPTQVTAPPQLTPTKAPEA